MLLLYSDLDKGQQTIFKHKAIDPLKLRAVHHTHTQNKDPNLSITLICFSLLIPKSL